MPTIVDINAETGEVFITEIPDPEGEINETTEQVEVTEI